MKKKLWTGSALFVGAAMLGALALSGDMVEAAVHDVDVEATITSTLVETVVRGINFGTVDLIPGVTETITLSASTLSTITSTAIDSTNPLIGSQNSPVSAFTYETGLITVASAFALDNVEVVYPAAPQNLVGAITGNILTITGMAANSFGGGVAPEANPLTKSANVNLNIHMGGVLNIPANSPNDTYVGTVPVTINYN